MASIRQFTRKLLPRLSGLWQAFEAFKLAWAFAGGTVITLLAQAATLELWAVLLVGIGGFTAIIWAINGVTWRRGQSRIDQLIHSMEQPSLQSQGAETQITPEPTTPSVVHEQTPKHTLIRALRDLHREGIELIVNAQQATPGSINMIELQGLTWSTKVMTVLDSHDLRSFDFVLHSFPGRSDTALTFLDHVMNKPEVRQQQIIDALKGKVDALDKLIDAQIELRDEGH